MSTPVYLVLLAAFFGAPGLFLGIAAGGKLARFGAPPGIALLAGAVIGLACGAVLAAMMIQDIESSSNANAPIALSLLPIPFVTNLAMGTLAAFVAYAWRVRPSM
jgi:hypothetical protein